MVLIEAHEYDSEQPPMGYIITTTLENGSVVINYGVFDTMDEAMKFGSKLINAVGRPIYAPVLH